MALYQPTSESYLQRAGTLLSQPNQSSKQTMGIGQGLMRDYREEVKPMMKSAREMAFYRPDLVNRAGVDAQVLADNAVGTVQRGLSRMGVNPNSGRFAGLTQEASLSGAAMKAGAMNRARAAEREGEFGRVVQAAGLGQNLPGTSLSALSQAAAQSESNAGALLNLSDRYGRLAKGQELSDRVERANRGADISARISEMKDFVAGMPNVRHQLQLNTPIRYSLR